MAQSQFTGEMAQAAFSYDPATGALCRKAAPGEPVGQPMKHGHLRVCAWGKYRLVHRIAWACHFGVPPDGIIDHINGNPGDNRIENLRIVSHAENMQNERRARRTNTSGLLGVRWCPRNKRWRAELSLQGKSQHIGLFDSAIAAHEAYLQAKRSHHPGSTL